MVEDNSTSESNEDSEASLPRWEFADRKRGILTRSDREYLLGHKQLTGQDERNTRYRIRQRTIEALHDLITLKLFLSEEDKRQIANSDEAPSTIEGSLLSWAYQLYCYDENVRDPIDEIESKIGEEIKIIEEEQIDSDAHPNRFAFPQVEIELDIEDIDVDELEYKLKRGTASAEEALIYKRLADGEENRTAEDEANKLIAEWIGLDWEPAEDLEDFSTN